MSSPDQSGITTAASGLNRSPVASETSWTVRRVESLSPVEFAALERLAFEYGQSPEAYLAIESDRHCILSPDHTMAMSVVVSGRYHHISGGILAPPEARPQAIAQLGEYARTTHSLIACYSITEQDRPLFEDAGWEVNKFGENTTIQLSSLNWSGKAYEWVRRQSNACLRAGLHCREYSVQALSSDAWDALVQDLRAIQQEDLRDRLYSQELHLLVGKLRPDQLGRRRLFVSENPVMNRIEAFVIANPMRGGAGWALEMFRKRQAAPRGTIPFLMKWIIDTLKAEGVEEVSLCLLLWKDCFQFVGKRTSLLLRYGLVLGYHLGDFLYHTKGMAHFKSRFRPELSNCYVCVTPKTSVCSILNFFSVVGALTFSLRNLVKSGWRVLTQKKNHDG